MAVEERIIYHGSQQRVEKPEIRVSRFGKDFGVGFYCTIIKVQAIRWATRFPVTSYVSEFAYTENPALKMKFFETMTEEWLDFVLACRRGVEHSYDIVEGPMADDQIWDYVEDYASGIISREAFWVLAKFKHPTNQIVFTTENALKTITYKNHYLL